MRVNQTINAFISGDTTHKQEHTHTEINTKQ